MGNVPHAPVGAALSGGKPGCKDARTARTTKALQDAIDRPEAAEPAHATIIVSATAVASTGDQTPLAVCWTALPDDFTAVLAETSDWAHARIECELATVQLILDDTNGVALSKLALADDSADALATHQVMDAPKPKQMLTSAVATRPPPSSRLGDDRAPSTPDANLLNPYAIGKIDVMRPTCATESNPDAPIA